MMHASPEDLEAYLDGALPDDRLLVTAAHLRTCRICQQRTNGFPLPAGLLDETLVALEPPAEPIVLPARIRAEIRRHLPPAWWRLLLRVLPVKLGLFILTRRVRRGSAPYWAAWGAIAALTLRMLVVPVRRAGPDALRRVRETLVRCRTG